jgi:hypothetical protein
MELTGIADWRLASDGAARTREILSIAAVSSSAAIL